MSDNDFLKVPDFELNSLKLHDYFKETGFLEPSQTTQLKKANKTLDNYLPRLESIIENQEKQIAAAVCDSESAKKEAMFSKLAAIVSIMISVIALIT